MLHSCCFFLFHLLILHINMYFIPNQLVFSFLPCDRWEFGRWCCQIIRCFKINRSFFFIIRLGNYFYICSALCSRIKVLLKLKTSSDRFQDLVHQRSRYMKKNLNQKSKWAYGRLTNVACSNHWSCRCIHMGERARTQRPAWDFDDKYEPSKAALHLCDSLRSLHYWL